MTKGITLQEIDTSATSRLVIKDSTGRAKVTAPSVADDIALKSTVDNAVGDLSTLQTTDKSNVVKAINELFTNVSNGRNTVAAAITGKGVPASGSDTFAQLAAKIGQIKTSVEDVMQDASDRLSLIQGYAQAGSSYSKITLDKNKNVLLMRTGGQIVILNKNMIPLYESTEKFSYISPILAPDGQYFYTLYRLYVSSGYEHRIAKYTTSGVKVWETPTVTNLNLQTRSIATNGDILVCLWLDRRLEFINASNGALFSTTTLDFAYDNVLWDEELGMFVCLYGDSNRSMAFVRTNGSIHKTTTTSAESEKDRRHLSTNVYKYIYGRELYPGTKF